MRYIGMVRKDAAGNILTFEAQPFGNIVLVLYSREHTSADLRAINNASAPTNHITRQVGPGNTDVAGRLVSPRSRVGFFVVNKTGANTLYVGWPSDPVTGRLAFEMPAAQTYMYTGPLRLGPNQEIKYAAPTGRPSFSLYVAGYYDLR
jgi:hypothetical protein